MEFLRVSTDFPFLFLVHNNIMITTTATIRAAASKATIAASPMTAPAVGVDEICILDNNVTRMHYCHSSTIFCI